MSARVCVAVMLVLLARGLPLRAQEITQTGDASVVNIYNGPVTNPAPPPPPAPPSPEEVHLLARRRLVTVMVRGGFEAQSSGARGATVSVVPGVTLDLARAATTSLVLRFELTFAYTLAMGRWVLPDETRSEAIPSVSVLDVRAEAAVGVHLLRSSAWSVSVDLGVGAGGALPVDVQRPDASASVTFPLTARLRGDRVFFEVRPQLALRPSYDVRYTGFLAGTAPTDLRAAFVIEGGVGAAF